MFEILDTRPALGLEDAIPMPRIAGAVTFENATFGYEAHRPTLRNVNLAVAPGEMIGLVGQRRRQEHDHQSDLLLRSQAASGSTAWSGTFASRTRARRSALCSRHLFVQRHGRREHQPYAAWGDAEEIMAAAKAANASSSSRTATTPGRRARPAAPAANAQRIAIARAVCITRAF